MERVHLDDMFLKGDKLPDIDALSGERWLPLETKLTDDMLEYWGGDFGVSSECTRLRSVILHRPGAEVENFDYRAARFRAPLDAERCRTQHDSLADYYRSHGIAVHYTPGTRPDRPNSIFCRDKLFMTPEGAIIGRLGISARRGEERYMAEALARLGVPIVKTIAGDGLFEGANAMWVDRHSCILSISARANRSGYEQVEAELRRQGVTDIIPMAIPYGHAHIDGLLNFPSEDQVVLHPAQVPYEVVDRLKKKGYEILEAPSFTEVEYGMGVNFVAIEPGHVVTSCLAPRTVDLMRRRGITVDVLDLSEINIGLGSVHCMTGFLKRD